MHMHFLKFVPALVLGDMVGVIVWLLMVMSQWTSAESGSSQQRRDDGVKARSHRIVFRPDA
jgi:hypothetical protein